VRRIGKEVRLEGINNIDDANAFLEEYLPLHNRRLLRNDNTISYQGLSTRYLIGYWLKKLI